MTETNATMLAGLPGDVKALLDRGADIDASDRWGRTALMWRAYWGDAETVKLAPESVSATDGMTYELAVAPPIEFVPFRYH